MIDTSQHPVIESEQENKREISNGTNVGTAPDLQGHASEPMGQETLSPAVVETGVNPGETHNQHAEAGRKGAHRIHELIRQGRLYEREHGLKPGRQRLRHLIQEAKLYQ